MIKILLISDEKKKVFVVLQMKVYTPINSEAFFSDNWPQKVGYTLCMNLKLDIYNHLDTLKS